MYRENIALAQHHDAITGTARRDVVDDYMKRLQAGDQKSIKVLEKALSAMASDTSISGTTVNSDVKFVMDPGVRSPKSLNIIFVLIKLKSQ